MVGDIYIYIYLPDGEEKPYSSMFRRSFYGKDRSTTAPHQPWPTGCWAPSAEDFAAAAPLAFGRGVFATVPAVCWGGLLPGLWATRRAEETHEP